MALSDSRTQVGAALPHNHLLIEVGWEVCNQVGGIYTVLRSKAVEMVKRWGDSYCLLGPLNHDQVQIEFEDEEFDDELGVVVKKLRNLGLELRAGRWQVAGRPRAVLLDLKTLRSRLPDIRARLQDEFGISIPEGDELVNDVVAFGEGTRLFLSMLAETSPGKQLIAHFHEWMAASAVSSLRAEKWSGRIVFTTHATILGRYLAMNTTDFYDLLPAFNPEKEAAKYHITAQYLLERAAAHGADVFTTVSEITGQECEHLLGRKVDALVPNGLNIKRFAALHEFQTLHASLKERLHEFTMGYFFPSYNFELENTLYFFSSGRFEYSNKGMDITLEALARLNDRLRKAGSPVTVIFLLITRQPVKSLSVGSLQYATMLREFKEIARSVTEEIRKHLIEELAAGRKPDLNAMIPENWWLRVRRAQHAWRRDWLPPVVTHDLIDDQNDPVLMKIREIGLFNNAHDPVKVVYHPDFVNSTSPLFGMDYEDLIRACHLGIFPSAYEPWGYTPLETLAMGVPAVSSDLAGFGAYAAKLRENHEKAGLYIVHRRGRSDDSTAEQLTNIMMRFCQQNRRRRIAQRNRAEAFAQHFDWSQLIHHYHAVHVSAARD